MPSWWVYIIQNAASDRLYTGISTDPDRRLLEHNKSPKGAKATRGGRPWEIVYREGFQTRGEALCREYVIKRLSRPQKLFLITQKLGPEPCPKK